MKIRFLFLFLAFFVFAGVGQIKAGEILTNEAIIKLSKAGVGEQVILDKIAASQTNFDVSINGLISLKGARVPDRIIGTMLLGPKLSPVPSQTSGGHQTNLNAPSQIRTSVKRKGDCEYRLAQFSEENPGFNREERRGSRRVGSFQLSAKRKVQIAGSLLERTANCFSLKRKGQVSKSKDKTLVSFDGGVFVFHDFYLAGNDSAFGVVNNRELGKSRTPYVQDAIVSTQITDPLPVETIVIKK